MIRFRGNINGISVEAQYSEQATEGIFLPFLDRMTELRKRKGKRILVMFAAPPGAGKTTLLSFLKQLSVERYGDGHVQVIGMDGFHRRQEYLLSHTAEKDGKQVSMVEIKGAPVTFDLERLTDAVRSAAAGENCGWPVYDRMLHNPVENAVTVDGDIVLLEGNYLLLDEDGWRTLHTYADYTVSVTAEEAMLRERLIARRVRMGVEQKAAERFVDFSDMPNVRLCLEKTLPADLRLRIGPDGEYELIRDESGEK